jgi:outer membrane protein
MQRSLTVLALSCCIVCPAGAQTLTDALATVYQTNTSVLAARAQLKASDNAVSQALGGWRPTVVIGGDAGYTRGRTRTRFNNNGVDQSFYSTSNYTPLTGTATITQPLLDGGRTTAQTEQTKNAVLAQRANVLAAEQQAMIDTVNAYVSVVRDKELLRLNQQFVDIVAAQLRATELRLKAGEVTRTDQSQAQSRLAGARISASQAAANLEVSRAAYRRVVGADPGVLTPPQPVKTVVADQKAAEAAASQDYPAVVAALFNLASAKDAVKVQIAQLLPQLSLQGQLFRDDNYSARGTRYSGEQITANLSVPLYQSGSEYAVVRQAQNQMEVSRHNLADQRRQAVQNAHQAWGYYVNARDEFASSLVNERAAADALDGVQREALIGSRTTLDVLNADAELLSARENRVQSLASLVQYSYAVNGAVGRLSSRDLRLPVPTYDWDEHYRRSRDALAGFEPGADLP